MFRYNCIFRIKAPARWRGAIFTASSDNVLTDDYR
jgi:hypothetical protein